MNLALADLRLEKIYTLTLATAAACGANEEIVTR